MRLLAIVFLAFLSGSGFAAAPHPRRVTPTIDPDGSARSSCPPISRYEASRHGRRPELRHLNELPGADLYSAVYRHIGNCNVPIIVRYNIGTKSEEDFGKR